MLALFLVNSLGIYRVFGTFKPGIARRRLAGALGMAQAWPSVTEIAI